MGHVQVERGEGVVTATLAQALEGEAKAQTGNFCTKDTAEPMLAFVDRREHASKGS
ncbi:MAG: hypothetical protein ACRD0V_04440 [Acidimicrobiales bacterium]